MLTADRDEPPHRRSRTRDAPPDRAAPLDDSAQELAALREAERVKLARGVENRVDELREVGELGADVGDVVVG